MPIRIGRVKTGYHFDTRPSRNGASSSSNLVISHSAMQAYSSIERPNFISIGIIDISPLGMSHRKKNPEPPELREFEVVARTALKLGKYGFSKPVDYIKMGEDIFGLT